jgi:hypothetical protein
LALIKIGEQPASFEYFHLEINLHLSSLQKQQRLVKRSKPLEAEVKNSAYFVAKVPAAPGYLFLRKSRVAILLPKASAGLSRPHKQVPALAHLRVYPLMLPEAGNPARLLFPSVLVGFLAPGLDESPGDRKSRWACARSYAA